MSSTPSNYVYALLSKTHACENNYPGPPSQSLGVDPADPAVMRKPPRSKDEGIISRRVIGRVIFSASIIVFGTLFLYATALSDMAISARDQTMVRATSLDD